MVKKLSLKCDNCSAPLQLSKDFRKASCEYCGNESLLIWGNISQTINEIEDALEECRQEDPLAERKKEIQNYQDQFEIVRYDALEAFQIKKDISKELTEKKIKISWNIAKILIFQFFVLKVNFSLNWYFLIQILIVYFLLMEIKKFGFKTEKEKQKKIQVQIDYLDEELGNISKKIELLQKGLGNKRFSGHNNEISD